MPVPMTNRFEQALVFAAQLHREQRRKGTGVPYVSHLLAVAALVIEHGGDEDEAIAALLHDAIEDQGGAKAREEIRRRFGDRVTGIVDGCTDSEIIPKPPGAKENGSTSSTSETHPRRSGASPLPTNSTTRAASSATTATWARTSGNGLRAAGKGRCGTTGPCSMSSCKPAGRRLWQIWNGWSEHSNVLPGRRPGRIGKFPRIPVPIK